MKLIEGQIIHSRYRLEKRVAQGGMGEVWKAYDLGAKREVAVKALRSDLEENSSRLERMRIEAKNSAYLAHPAIAALFDYYENNGMGFLIMEYIPWPSLAQIYKEAGKIPPKKLLPLISQVAKGLYVAHKNGVIHRDIKPANIMVSPEGKVKITDFGVRAIVMSFGVPNYPHPNYPTRSSTNKHALNLELMLRNGRTISFDYDVTDQLAKQPHGGVIVIKDIVIKEDDGTQGTGAFDVEVKDWGEYEDIYLPL